MANSGVIYSEISRVPVRVIRRDEEWMISTAGRQVLGLD